MRENKVKRALAQGGESIGTMMLEFSTTGIARLAASAGAEFAVFDMEHSGWSMETIRMLMATTRMTEMAPLVRPPTNQYHLISRALDMGAMGIVIPFVNTPEQARQMVDCARYPPAGRRGTAFSMPHDDYQGGDILEKIRSANEEILLVAQIETREGLENVEKIAAVEGIDAVWIGQFDLTTSLGIPGDVKHPQFVQAQRRILEACQRAGKAAGYGSLFIEDIHAARRQGFRYLVYTADLWIYQRALKDGLRRIREGNGDPGR